MLIEQQRPQHMGRPTLVLDLDHTLVHGEVKRPGLDEFLDTMAGLYEIVLFTAAPRELVSQVVDNIDKGRISFRLFGESCVTPVPGVKHKLLKDLGRDMKKVVVVDDTPSTYKYNQENAVPISAFYRGAEDTDQELLGLIPFLTGIAQSEDIRSALCQRKGFAKSQKVCPAEKVAADKGKRADKVSPDKGKKAGERGSHNGEKVSLTGKGKKVSPNKDKGRNGAKQPS